MVMSHTVATSEEITRGDLALLPISQGKLPEIEMSGIGVEDAT